MKENGCQKIAQYNIWQPFSLEDGRNYQIWVNIFDLRYNVFVFSTDLAEESICIL